MKETAHVPPQLPSTLPAALAFIGEAPSTEEVDARRPFVGPAGRIFSALLRTAGIEREDALVTNVFDFALPGGDLSNLVIKRDSAVASGADGLPSVAGGFISRDLWCHLDRLQRELEQCKPTVIVPLGGTALWALTGLNNITAQRGVPAVATRLVPGTKIVPTLAPAMVMAQWKFYPVVVGDLIRAATEVARGPSLFQPKRELLIEPTLDDLAGIKSELLASPLLSVDIETGWGQVTSIGFAASTERGICVPFVDKRQPNRSYWPTGAAEVAAWEWVREICESPTPKVGQNFNQYDAFWLLKKKHIAVRNLLQDTRLIHHALYPELPKDLAFMGNSYATQGTWKEWGHGGNTKRDN